MYNVAVLVIGDGRDQYLCDCMKTLNYLQESDDTKIVEWWMYDDTGSETYRNDLAKRYPSFRHINAGKRQGFSGAYRSSWAQLAAGSTADLIFLIEGDFKFIRPIPLDIMAKMLNRHPELAQIALRRQAWNEVEKAAGGIVESHPDWYRDRWDHDHSGWECEWLEHRAFFTTNPCMFRRSLLTVEWPTGLYSEGTFHHKLLANGTPEVPGDQVRYAYLGARDSGIWVEHIGYERAGEGY